MSHDLIIDRARNGWVIIVPTDEPDMMDRIEVVEEHENDEDPEGFALLSYIMEELGLYGNRHDARRIYLGWKPGDKHHDLHPRPCADCECQCDPDQSTGPLDGIGMT